MKFMRSSRLTQSAAALPAPFPLLLSKRVSSASSAFTLTGFTSGGVNGWPGMGGTFWSSNNVPSGVSIVPRSFVISSPQRSPVARTRGSRAEVTEGASRGESPDCPRRDAPGRGLRPG